MIFNELYGAYFAAIAKVISSAVERPLKSGEFKKIVSEQAFGESVLNLTPTAFSEKWQLLKEDGTTPLKHSPTMPLTLLQKRWLKAISLDPRIKLFGEEIPALENIEPLFLADDFYIFDKYSDGDPFEDELYRRVFGIILNAIRKQKTLAITTMNRYGEKKNIIIFPERLEYSQKDDKFRLIGSSRKYSITINVARIICAKVTQRKSEVNKNIPSPRKKAEFELINERNTLERVLLHFADLEKEAVKVNDDLYKLSVFYDENDESELVIRVLSFGPMIKVTAPEDFKNLIIKKLTAQENCTKIKKEKSCEY